MKWVLLAMLAGVIVGLAITIFLRDLAVACSLPWLTQSDGFVRFSYGGQDLIPG